MKGCENYVALIIPEIIYTCYALICRIQNANGFELVFYGSEGMECVKCLVMILRPRWSRWRCSSFLFCSAVEFLLCWWLCPVFEWLPLSFHCEKTLWEVPLTNPSKHESCQMILSVLRWSDLLVFYLCLWPGMKLLSMLCISTSYSTCIWPSSYSVPKS